MSAEETVAKKSATPASNKEIQRETKIPKNDPSNKFKKRLTILKMP